MIRRMLLPGVVLLCMAMSASAKPAGKAVSADCVVQLMDEGRVDWTHCLVKARGVGVAPGDAGNPTQASALAREAAIAVAERNLLLTIYRVKVHSEQTVESLAKADATVTTHIAGLVRGARILEEKVTGDGTYEVVMGIGLFGTASVADCIEYNQLVTATVQASDRPTVVLPAPHPAPVDATLGDSVAATLTWTGVIIDCRGLHLQPSMEPCVLDTDEQLLYPNRQVPKGYDMSQGLVCYSRSPDDPLLQRRVGKFPLVIKAVTAVGDTTAKYHPVISAPDAVRISTAELRSKLLSNFAVAILVD